MTQMKRKPRVLVGEFSAENAADQRFAWVLNVLPSTVTSTGFAPQCGSARIMLRSQGRLLMAQASAARSARCCGGGHIVLRDADASARFWIMST